MTLISKERTSGSIRIRFQFLIFFFLLAVLVPASADKTRERQPRLVVPEQFLTIQEAIDAAPDGSIIIVHSGVYEEALTISGKTVHLDGSHGAALVRGPDPNPDTFIDLGHPQTAVINYENGGGGSVTALRIIGGDNAIAGFNPESLPGPLALKKIFVQGSGRGVLWSGAPIVISESYFSNLKWHGMSFPTCNSRIQIAVSDSQVIDSEQAGIYLRDCNPVQAGIPTCAGPYDINIKGVSLSFNKGGGILAVNSNLCVQNSYINFSNTGGIILLGSMANTSHNQINFTKAPVVGDGIGLGDGITAWAWNGVQPQVLIDNTTTYHSDRAGVSSFGAEVTIQSSSLVCSGFDIGAEDYGGFQSIFHDTIKDSVKCGCPFANAPCLAKSYQLNPPAPFGGLE